MRKLNGPQIPDEKASLLTFVVVGGGPTGVELAGAIAELAKFALAKDFNHIDPAATKVTLIEGGNRLLAAFDPKLSSRALAAIQNLNIEVQLNAFVTNISAAGVSIGETFLPTKTVVWAAGVQPSKLGQQLKAPLDKTGRVVVERDLSLPNRPEVFVVGDLAAVPWKGVSQDKASSGDEWVPGQAPGAIQEGRHAAANIRRLIPR